MNLDSGRVGPISLIGFLKRKVMEAKKGLYLRP
jgi:hypothetical protein